VKEEVNDANRYVFIESSIALGISLIINIAVTSVFAHGLHGKANREIFDTCLSRNDSRFDINAFSNDTEDFDADIYKAGVFLGCEFGLFTMYIWAIGILASGQSSTMTGTYSG
jgi:natural resistance-associated macrophage protein